MDNFMIGMYGKYDYKKIDRDFRKGFYGVEACLFENENDIEIIRRFSKYAEVVHLWNVRVDGNVENSHFPTLANLKPEEGWAPIEDYLKMIREENKNVKILFEHRSDLITDEELDGCYSWIDSIFNLSILK